jgi:hypothetical protein
MSSTLLTSGGDPIAVHLHQHDGDPAEPRPAVIVTASWLTVKEQMADHYAAVGFALDAVHEHFRSTLAGSR